MSMKGIERLMLFRILKTLCACEASGSVRVVGVLARFFVAHIRFLYANHFKFKWVNGITLWAVRHRHSSTSCYYFRMYDYSEMNFLSRYIRKGDVFVDAGSNIGSYSILAASYGAFVVSIEPSPSACVLQRKNIDLNHGLGDKIQICNFAIGESDSEALFSVGYDTTNKIVDADMNACRAIKVKVRALDGLVKEGADILKMDIEGYEELALRGAKKVLEASDLNVIIIESFQDSKIIRLLESYGFQPYGYDVKRNKLYCVDGRRNGNNMIFIRNCRRALERIGK